MWLAKVTISKLLAGASHNPVGNRIQNMYTKSRESLTWQHVEDVSHTNPEQRACKNAR